MITYAVQMPDGTIAVRRHRALTQPGALTEQDVRAVIAYGFREDFG